MCVGEAEFSCLYGTYGVHMTSVRQKGARWDTHYSRFAKNYKRNTDRRNWSEEAMRNDHYCMRRQDGL